MKPLKIIDHLVSKEVFKLEYSERLQAWETTPFHDEKELLRFYPPNNYTSHVTKPKNLIEIIYVSIRSLNIKLKLGWINKYRRNKKLLDYGAGNGAFAQAAKQQGWDVSVFETSPKALKRLRDSNLKTLNPLEIKTKYDVITLWHVFEHLNFPEKALAQFSELLNTGGVLVLALPNTDSWDSNYYKSKWAAFDVPRHRWHYNKRAIKSIAVNNGFELVEIKNMYWDGFYISLLSEKHSLSSLPWLKAFFVGFYSNLKGMCSKNTSSLTFILKKAK